MNRTRVINIHRHQGEYEYIGRPSVCGNPFVMGKDGNREEVIESFKAYFYSRLATDGIFRTIVESYKGETLGCFCRPADGFTGKVLCHGQIVAGYLDGISPSEVV